MAHSALVDVADAVFKILNVPSLTAPDPIGAGATGGVTAQPVVTARVSFPFVWYELAAERMVGALGAGPWLLEIDLRVHVFSQAPGMDEAQTIIQEAIRLIRESRGVVTGWGTGDTRDHAPVPRPFELLNGVPVRELVAEGRWYVEEA